MKIWLYMGCIGWSVIGLLVTMLVTDHAPVGFIIGEFFGAALTIAIFYSKFMS